MKTKKVMTLLVLLLAGMFVSAQVQMSYEEAVMFEKMMRNQEVSGTNANSASFNLYQLLLVNYNNSPFSEVHPTSREYRLSDSNDQKYKGVPSVYMPPAYGVFDNEEPIRSKLGIDPRPPRPTIEGTPRYSIDNKDY